MVGAGTDRTRPPLGGGPAIILVRPQLAVNIGMCARAMANFGLDDLRLVNPREGWPRSDEYRDVAYAAAAGATDLLDSARVFASVEAAVGDLPRVYATTARERGQMKAVLSPSAAMGASAAATGEKRGILFGPERTGLDNDEVALADAIVTFPSSPTYASLNLSQAVLLCGYEWFKAAHGDAPPPPTIPRPQSPPAQREMLLAFFNFLEDKLDQNGFFRPVTKKPGMRRNLRNIFHRMELTQQDVRTLWGAVVRLVEGPRVEVKTRKRERPKKPGALARAGRAAVSQKKGSRTGSRRESQSFRRQTARERRASDYDLGACRGRRRLVVHVMVVMVMMMMVMVVMRCSAIGAGAGSGGVLRHGVAGEAEREHGGGGRVLIMRSFPVVRCKPQRVVCRHKAFCLN